MRVGVVVPTLGTRPRYLKETLSSIRASGDAHVCVVAPPSADVSQLLAVGLIDSVIEDPGGGLAAAINRGVASLPGEIEYVNWLGDDDLLEPRALSRLVESLDSSGADFMWGSCRYINSQGDQIGLNRSGTWAKWLIRVGPNLIPQPGALFRRSVFDDVGGLDVTFGWAFDQDLFTKFVRGHRVLFAGFVVSSFRWHAGSLSAGARRGSVRESSQIRVRNLPAWLRPISPLWELPMRRAITLAGAMVTRRSK